jgi:endoglucanase Acf2
MFMIKLKRFVDVVIISIILSIPLFAQSPGSYTTIRPSTVTDPPLPVITSNIKGPVLTTDWCASLAFSDTSENMFAHPLAFKCTQTGLELGYPNTTISEPNYYYTPFNHDIKVSVKGISSGKAAMDHYTDWSVRALWDGGSGKERRGAR